MDIVLWRMRIKDGKEESCWQDFSNNIFFEKVLGIIFSIIEGGIIISL